MLIPSIRDYDFSQKRVLVRVDFNLPLDSKGEILDSTRLIRSLPTLDRILEDEGSRILLISHLGRPKGIDPKYSLEGVARRLEEIWKRRVSFCSSCIGTEAHQRSLDLPAKGVLLMENLRFHEDETKNESGFAKELARLGDVFVDDAFGNAHRKHASNVGITKFFQDNLAGYLLEEEMKAIGHALKNSHAKKLALVGGAKVSDKILLLQRLLDRVDTLVLGGGMVYTFSYATGGRVGSSLLERESVGLVRDLLSHAQKTGKEIILPVDIVTAREIRENTDTFLRPLYDIPDGEYGLDIGEKSLSRFADHIRQARAVIWNGPMGMFEISPFSRGTRYMAELIKEITRRGRYSLVGGGDLIAAIGSILGKAGATHISTGGGAMLAFIEGKPMYGVEALRS
ncbi:MAG: phosphoglycerate kinase [Cytophagales bacterium]|nr:phosphoglycerate kinase [Cytophagales bacterium]